MATVEITLDAEATGRVIPAVPEAPPAHSHGGLPGEPAHVENLCITVRVPARCVGRVDAQGYVNIDLTALVPEMDTDAAADTLIEEYEAGSN